MALALFPSRCLLGGIALAAALGFARPAAAQMASSSPAMQDPLGTCLQNASAIRAPGEPGNFVKVEYLNPSADGVPTYEIELRDASGSEWEFMCNAQDGSIYEIEQEAESASDERFRNSAEVSEDEARQTVLNTYPGEIVEVEYEIESNGMPTYEMDVSSDGTEWKVEVDAVTGDIVEVHVERWEIGIERAERE